MNNNDVGSLRRTFWLPALSVVLVSCSGGGGTDAGVSAATATAPVAVVDAPVAGAVVKQSPATIEGQVEPGDATVTVAGAPAVVANGRFAATVALREGANSIDIVASNAAGRTKTALAVTLNSTEMCGTGETFTTELPGLSLPDDPNLNGPPLPTDSVALPNGCDVYAIFVHGYGRNGLFDELMFYKLAKWVAEHNGYVHWSWWNNFVGEYMSRPLHVIAGTKRGDDSYPTPGDITERGNKWDFARGGSGKAVPDEDFQFQEDARRVLTAIRQNNPNAILIVAGHSMGGNAVIRLGSETLGDDDDVPIDLLAPIDPVGNRNLPEGQGGSVEYATGLKSAVPGSGRRYQSGNETFNWTRWRATRHFQGWVDRDCVRGTIPTRCKDFAPLNPLKIDIHCYTVDPIPRLYKPPPEPITGAGIPCPDLYPATRAHFGPNIKRLYHRWQQETFFPFDWEAGPIMEFERAKLHQERPFDVKYRNYQRAVEPYARSELPAVPLTTAPKTCAFPDELDPSGAQPFGSSAPLYCEDWDGHGEIIGMRATKHRPVLSGLPPAPTKENLNPLAATADYANGKWARTEPWSPQIGDDDTACVDDPCRAEARRRALIMLAEPGAWEFAPKNPNLDLVVNDLVAIAEDLWAARTPSEGPDETPPTSSASLDVEPTTYGWNNTDVVASITAVDEDGGSGVKEIVYSMTGATSGSGTIAGDAVDLAIGAEGETTIEYFARDNAGNEEAPNTLVVKIDETPPTIAASNAPPPNEYGWNNTDVTVTFTADDALSGIDTVTDPVTLTEEGADQEVIGVAADRAGNTASLGVIVNIDKTPPVIGGLPENCELWPPNHQLVHVADIVVSDALSGVDQSMVQGVSSEPASGPTFGNFVPDVEIDAGAVELRAERYSPEGRTYDLTVGVTDRAGNAAEGAATCLVPHDQRP